MSRFLSGLMMVLFALLINAISAFIGSDSASASAPVGCTTNNNFTTCQDVTRTSFLAQFFSATVTGVSGAPTWFNVFYVLVMDTVLVGGIILMVISLIPTLGN